MGDGSPFPGRDLAIFLAAGVIIVSLLAASIGLPFLLKNLHVPAEPSHQREEDEARIRGAEAAIKAIEQLQHDMGEGRADADLYADAGARLMDIYRQRIAGRSKTGDDAMLARRSEEIERKLRLAGVKAERAEFFRLARNRKLSEELMKKLVREADLAEARFSGP
jgi:CPA1 family monovalent cation:H+ antiporter